MPPNRGDNALMALSILGDGEYIIFRATWHIEPASESSRLLHEIQLAIERLQASLEAEVRASCQRVLRKVTEE